jgi:hypothetical protein
LLATDLLLRKLFRRREPGHSTGERKLDRATPFAPAVIAPAQMAFSSSLAQKTQSLDQIKISLKE